MNHLHFILNQFMDAWQDLTTSILNNPEIAINSQFNYWQDYQKLLQENEFSPTQLSDKRFKDNAWQENIIHAFVKQSYLLLSQHMENFVHALEKHDNVNAEKLKFFIRQFLNALSPSNFIATNPEVLSKIAETNGENLMSGFKQFFNDFENGQLNLKMTDASVFKLGENIACTPGKVIYQNDIMQLIQYAPQTDNIHQLPLLIIPPWINKFYILDLQAENSLVKWLVDKGFTVFMISWVNPSTQHKEKRFEDYLFDGPLAALDIIQKITGEQKTNVLGYCIGGTLLGCLLAYLAKKNTPRIQSATFLTTLFDFSQPGDLGAFVDEKQISLMEDMMQKNGYLDGNVMATVFNALRANDLIWSSFINQYLKGEKPKAFDLLYWNSDATNIPEKVHQFYLREMYLHNHLIQANQICIDNVGLDLSKIKIPTYFLAAQDDHIVPWMAAYNSHRRVGGKTNFVLTTSGHVAGVVNPPHKNKYGYWSISQPAETPEEFLNNAKFYTGSWWENWLLWLKIHSGKLVPASTLNTSLYTAIEDAPGSYVKVQLNH